MTKQILVLATSFCLGMTSSASADPHKKLIYYGIDAPDTSLVRKNLARMEKAPFDGWVFLVTSDSPRGQERMGDFSMEPWCERAFTKAELQHAVDDLQATPFTTLTDNFVRFNNGPGHVDWFDDFDVILNNVRLAGWIAKQGGLKGVLYDTEQYPHDHSAPLFDYTKQRHAKTKSFDEYAVQVHKRGAQVMRALQEEYSDITVFFTLTYSYIHWKPWPKQHMADIQGAPRFREFSSGPRKLETFFCGLLPAFLDGMIEAAGPQVRLIDGSEWTYMHIRRSEFIRDRKMFNEGVLKIVGDQEKYRKVFSQAFAVWVDPYHWVPDRGWDAQNFSNNFNQPVELEMALTNALDLTDEYVWLYSERQTWGGRSKNVPDAYEQAVRNARRAIKVD